MKSDRFFIALTSAALAAVALMLISLILVVVYRGMGTYWVSTIHEFEMKDSKKVLGAITDVAQSKKHPEKLRYQIKVGNRDLYGLDFRWIEEEEIANRSIPTEAWCIERMEYGNFYASSAEYLEEEKEWLLKDVSGREVKVHAEHVVRIYQNNQMNVFEKGILYVDKWFELLTEEPREANTEGGLYPAIFGTILLIFVMSIVSFPFGVIAAIYMREYAKDGIVLRAVRVAVNNLAGIPSIVFGIFGLGFFVYRIGGGIDNVLFSDTLPTPTFGTGGLLWASVTLGLLTVPVVIVSTEEALSVIPKGIREGSLALGANKLQTLVKVLIPMASPGILTGFILAMTRAAGEVAPLMMTGVVKLAPSLPLDGEFPFIHLDRKFMHLGFHIYDIGFQSPNVEAAMPMVFVTTLLLLTIVISMTSGAIFLRNYMRRKYTSSHL
jgi:phosphate transport system permease protein